MAKFETIVTSTDAGLQPGPNWSEFVNNLSSHGESAGTLAGRVVAHEYLRTDETSIDGLRATAVVFKRAVIPPFSSLQARDFDAAIDQGATMIPTLYYTAFVEGGN